MIPAAASTRDCISDHTKRHITVFQRAALRRYHHDFEGDTHFPEVDFDQWKEVERENHDPDEKNIYSYSFVTFERKYEL